MAENFGLSRFQQGDLPDKPIKIPVRIIKDAPSSAAGHKPWITCDRDPACDRARFEIVTPSGSLYFCGHHFYVYFPHACERDYEIREL